jgi:hypothetical protein
MVTTQSNNKGSSHSSGLTLSTVRDRTVDEIEEALQRSQPDLIEALPGTGKSRGVVEAVSRLEVQITVFTCRGRKEQYKQFQKWCNIFGLSSFVLPSAYEDCPTVDGDHGQKLEEKTKALLSRGVSPSRLHKQLDLPCEMGGNCPYMKKCNQDLSEYDILLGHYSHAHNERVLQDRIPVFDEFPEGTYFNKLSPKDITVYLQSKHLPFGDFVDLLENRDDTRRRRKAINRLRMLTPGLRDGSLPFNQSDGHALSGLGVLTLLKGNDFDNGWEQACLGNDQVGLFDREKEEIYVFDPPTLSDNIVALDGTPTKVMWELVLGLYDKKGRSLNVQRVLNEQERREYVRGVQKLKVVPTTNYDKHYSSGRYTKPEPDSALVTAVRKRHGDKVGIISSEEGLDNLLINTDKHETQHYGNIRGSDSLSDVDAGVILGSPHYGDDFIKKWGALAGICVEPDRDNGGRASYGESGEKILDHIHSEVTQAMFRFSRQGDGATVYVNTGVLPDWMPTVAEPSDTEIQTWSNGKQDIIHALKQLGSAKTSEIANKSGLTTRYVRKVLTQLIQQDLVDSSKADDGRGGAKVYFDTGLSARNKFGLVDLPPVARESGFSEQTPNNTLEGIFPKNDPWEIPWEIQKERNDEEAYREAMRREERVREHVKMERLRS